MKPGTFASVGKIRVLILQVCIDSHLTDTYQVCWWDEMTRKTEWVTHDEINLDKDTQLDWIGFTL